MHMLAGALNALQFCHMGSRAKNDGMEEARFPVYVRKISQVLKYSLEWIEGRK